MRAGEGYRHGVLAMWSARVRSIPVHGRFDFSERFAFFKGQTLYGFKAGKCDRSGMYQRQRIALMPSRLPPA